MTRLRIADCGLRIDGRPGPSAARVSVIITCYNYAHLIAGAVESVLAQTVRPGEIVVIDDGSTDGTAEVVARYAEQGVRYVYKENGGAGSARNRGLQETSGDLVAFLDGDDRWVPNKLALQLEHMQTHPEVGLVTGSEWQVYQSGEEPLLIRRPPVGAAVLYPQILVENFLGNPSLTLVRRECFERVGNFNEGMRLGQDWDMWIRIAREFSVGVVDAPLIHFTRHEGSLTSGQRQARYRSNRAMQRRYIAPLKPFALRARLLLAAQSMNCYYTAAGLAEEPGRRGAALALALAAALLDPTHETWNKFVLPLRLVAGPAVFARLHSLARWARAERWSSPASLL